MKESLQTYQHSFRSDTLTPIAAYQALCEKGNILLFESMEGFGRNSRYTIIARNPLLTFRHSAGKTLLTGQLLPTSRELTGNPFVHLKKVLNTYEFPESGLFQCGLMAGYIGFETFRYIEPTALLRPSDAEDPPEIMLMLPGEVLRFDNFNHNLDLILHAPAEATGTMMENRAEDLLKNLTGIRPDLQPPRDPLSTSPVESDLPGSDFKNMVEQAREHIMAGDIFQVVLSRRKEITDAPPALELYRELRRQNPSPYLYLLETDEVSLIGASPETMVRCEGDRILMRPIAGTRPRGTTRQEDHSLELGLLADEKELAEHDMLVDLSRNDVGRVSRMGSVQVPEYRLVERYSHVMHLVSTVTGRLEEDQDAVDVFTACFPAGTVSGAPKIRAMQIIADLETHPRGPYAGAVGYFDFAGRTDTCIAIRTAVQHKGRTWWQAGAGIVADSRPDRELAETENKGRILAGILTGEEA